MPWWLVAALCLWLSVCPAALADDLAVRVDPLVGTDGNGLVAPGATVPFGMVQNSPDTPGAIGGGYHVSRPTISGFSLLHLSGAGVKSEGDLPFMPTVGNVSRDDPARFASHYDQASERRTSPGYYRVHLTDTGIDVELTATARTALQRYTFPPVPNARVVIDAAQSLEGVHRAHVSFSRRRHEVSGWVRGRYPVFFVARFDRPFVSHGGFRSGRERRAGGWVGFDTRRNASVTVHVGISFVDVRHARLNLASESARLGFDAVHAKARAAWVQALSTLRLEGGTEEQQRVVYTALYHAIQYPNVFSDVDGAYLGFDRRIHHTAPGHVQYADFSAWDGYRAQDQLQAWLFPSRYRDILLSLLNDYRQSGRLPRWAEKNLDTGYTVGDPAIPMIADGVCNGLLGRGDEEALYQASADLVRRRPLLFESLGFVPGDASRTLEYGVADFSLALLADRLGHPDVAAAELDRSLRYRNVLDPDSGWIRPRMENGSWLTPFQPDGSAGFYESTARRNSWLAAHDARGLFTRMGGDDVVVERLDALLSGSFGTTYGRDNEEDMQAPWMYVFAGAPWRAQAVLRDLQPAFTPARDGIPGNDDLGALSAGHVFRALGIGPVTAGAPFFAIGSPEFPNAVLTPEGSGASFTISAPGVADGNGHIDSARLDGSPLDRAWVYASTLRAPGRLDLEMRFDPNTDWAAAPEDAPPSLSDSPLERFGCR